MAGRPADREIISIALPALGALAAEPLYLLADTAIVGHLGTVQLAALALAAAILSAVVILCNFLAYGTTARVARFAGAGDDRSAVALGTQALWLGLCVGLALALLSLALAGPLMGLLAGDHPQVAHSAARYLRLSVAGLPCALIALAAQGYLRGVANLRTPLVIVVVANIINVGLELWFVYGLGWGLDGSALGTVCAQLVMAAAFVAVVLRGASPSVVRSSTSAVENRPTLRPDFRELRSLGGASWPIVVRSGVLLLSFIVAGAVLARVGPAALGGHQVAFQLFIFLALVLDALAIAAQVLVGRALGAGDGELAMDTAQRMCWWSLVAGVVLACGLIAGTNVLPKLFTDDPAVLASAHRLWLLFALMLPFGAVVFALDGILLGAGDTRYLAGAMVFAAAFVYMPIALASLHFGWGVRGVWWGLVALMVARLATLLPRLIGRRWIRLGAT